jgi:hypothetical protein
MNQNHNDPRQEHVTPTSYLQAGYHNLNLDHTLTNPGMIIDRNHLCCQFSELALEAQRIWESGELKHPFLSLSSTVPTMPAGTISLNAHKHITATFDSSEENNSDSTSSGLGKRSRHQKGPHSWGGLESESRYSPLNTATQRQRLSLPDPTPSQHRRLRHDHYGSLPLLMDSSIFPTSFASWSDQHPAPATAQDSGLNGGGHELEMYSLGSGNPDF